MGAKSSFQSRRDAGVTLMEIIAALAIISVIVVGALALYQSAKSSEDRDTINSGCHGDSNGRQKCIYGGYWIRGLFRFLHAMQRHIVCRQILWR